MAHPRTAEPIIPVYLRLPVELVRALDARADEERVPRTEIIKEALEAYLGKENEQ